MSDLSDMARTIERDMGMAPPTPWKWAREGEHHVIRDVNGSTIATVTSGHYTAQAICTAANQANEIAANAADAEEARDETRELRSWLKATECELAASKDKHAKATEMITTLQGELEALRASTADPLAAE